jgi:predicted CXXCH cytochrome family protein
MAVMPPIHHNLITAGVRIVATGLLILSGCRSQTPPVAQPPPAVASGPSVQPSAATATESAGLTPSAESGEMATTRNWVAPQPDPGGCLTIDCHQSLVRVTYRHAPLQAGACDTCHETEQPGHKFPLRRADQETCTFCHQVTGHRKHLHAAIEKQGCLPCHNPHGSDTKFLLRDASAELTCKRCHAVERQQYLHGPFASGQCTACHQPHESDNKFLLIGGEGANHCLTCHQAKQRQIMAAAVIHKPMEEGCTQCHDPHSSAYRHVLKAPIEELCFSCHHDIEGTVAAASTPHGALLTGERCGNCHDPHAAGGKFLLLDDLQKLCLNCHDKPQQAYDGRVIPDMRPVLTNRKFLHGPVKNGQCNACHKVHGSSIAKLLRDRFPEQFYEAFDLAEYALCFDCHSSAMVLEKETTTLTNFRDGSRNLHFVHVNRSDKGRTCRTCHEIHGSNLPRHMATMVPFEGGAWSMPIQFEPNDRGGSCSPGCHAPKKYERTGAAPPPPRSVVQPPPAVPPGA